MWVASSSGFISVVQHLEKPDFLLVRARARKDLQSLFDDNRIFEIKEADYRYRIEVNKQEFAEIMVNQIKNINYPNFKSHISTLDDQRDKLAHYHDIWYVMRRYGKELENIR